MKKRTTTIDAGTQDISRPSERPSKSNWKIKMIQMGLKALQYVTPRRTAKIVWYYFTKPGKVRFKESHLELLDKADKFSTTYEGYNIQGYRWGYSGPKVLLAHGWRSKISDFRRMIYALTEAGFIVEGLDMKAHGNSEGKHTAIPEMRDIIKEHYVNQGPYYAVIGYSIGGLAASMAMTEISPKMQPKHLIIISAPPYVSYFFKDVTDELGFNDRVYQEMAQLVKTNYQVSIDYLDLRTKQNQLNGIDMTLIYDEIDQTVPFEKGLELHQHYPEAHFVHSKGLGHYKIIAYDPIFNIILKQINKEMVSSPLS